MDDASDSSTRDRIILLKDLHRPLEEHWAGNKKVDAVGSDYTYKHHITRLEKVYTAHKVHPKIDLGPPIGPANISPQTQLFGRGGIAPELTKKQIRRREKGWDKYHGHIEVLPKSYSRQSDIQEKRIPPASPRTRSRSRSPSHKEGHHRPNSAGSMDAFKAAGKKRKGKSHKKIKQTRDHSMCLDPYLTREQLVIMGLYRFETEDEHAIYSKFVQMLTRFDTVDKLKIIQDAYSDSQQASNLSAFSGTNVIE
jgi:hypothetical protein